MEFSTADIVETFESYIRRKNIVGIDNLDSALFRRNIIRHANHIANEIGSFKFSPYLEKLISKGRDKAPRLIAVPTIKDRIVLYILKEQLHDAFPECVNKDLINMKIVELFEFLQGSEQVRIIKVDIRNYYGSINQRILLDILERKMGSGLVLDLVDKAIVNPTVPKDYSREEKTKFAQYTGIPQGLAISNILANIYLEDVDHIMRQSVEYYYRYVDDIILVTPAHRVDQVFETLIRHLQRLGLEINTDKTIIHDRDETINYLGYKLSRTAIEVKDENVQSHINQLFALLSKFLRQLEHPETREKWLTDDLLFQRVQSEMNEKITGAISESKKYGWLFYYSSINSTEVLHKLNKILAQATKRILPEAILTKLKVKSYVRAFYEIKNQPRGGYIENYDLYDTLEKKDAIPVLQSVY